MDFRSGPTLLAVGGIIYGRGNRSAARRKSSASRLGLESCECPRTVSLFLEGGTRTHP
jgi:hypothetical protein